MRRRLPTSFNHSPSGSSAPRGIVSSRSRVFLAIATKDFDGDEMIWTNRRFLSNPKPLPDDGPIIAYRNVEDAIERANATHYGLSASVWSADPEKAAEVARELECGTAWVNQHLAIAPNLPFGGAKWSGIGVENGPWGLLGFTEIQTLNIAKG